MPRLIFERTRFEVDVPDGSHIVDVCDEHVRAGVPFACRHANCGSCRVEVTEGLRLCEAANDAERALLDHVFMAPPNVRLACQLVVTGRGVVRLRVLR